MSSKIKEVAQVLVALVISSVLCAVCVNLCLYANLGSDSITVFEDGLHRLLNISIGTASLIYNAILIVIALIIARKHIGWTTIAFSLMMGTVIDLMDWWMAPVFGNPTSLVVRWIYIVVAIAAVAASSAILILYRKGMSVLDAVCFGVGEKIKVEFRVVRTVADALLLVVGWLMGGVVGLGSIPTILLTGTCTQWFVDLFRDKHHIGFKSGD